MSVGTKLTERELALDTIVAYRIAQRASKGWVVANFKVTYDPTELAEHVLQCEDCQEMLRGVVVFDWTNNQDLYK